MARAAAITFGAPGIYPAPEPPLHALTGVPLDVCAFVGVAPRGPAREPIVDAVLRKELGRDVRRCVPVAVDSFDHYRRLYGGFEGPGLLPSAVAAFFEQGGRRAIVVRVVHDYDDDVLPHGRASRGNEDGVARARLPLLRADGRRPRLRARNEGAWGNGLRVELGFAARPLALGEASAGELVLPEREAPPAGTLLRLTLPGGVPVLRFVARVEPRWRDPGGLRPLRLAAALLDAPLAAVPERAEVVTATLRADDGAGRAEEHARLGLSSLHERFLGDVLRDESELLYPDGDWRDVDVLPLDPLLPPLLAARFRGGFDRYRRIVEEDFFDRRHVPGDPGPGEGVHALLDEPEAAVLCVPDLYAPQPLPDFERLDVGGSIAGPVFEDCVHATARPTRERVPELAGLRLDPRTQLEQVVARQARLEELVEEARRFVCLLDVPPGLGRREVVDWRARFSSAFLAAYHPWLLAARPDDERDVLVRVPPSAYAAGILARRELASGVPFGPWNELAAGAVDAEERLPRERLDELHLAAVNVFVPERDGVRLTAGRTLSHDPDWRQLSVRRLITMLELALERQLQWVVFEPNGPELHGVLREAIRAFLRRLWLANAFAGATEEEAYFVRCDETTMTQSDLDDGRLVCLIGVAPAEPLEYLVLRLAREGDGTLALGEARV